MIINFVGDLCLDRIDPDKFHIEDAVLKIFKGSDLNIANLESPLTQNESIRPNTLIALKSVPTKNKILEIFNVFSLTNNHILDYGLEGFLDTISFLKKCEKKYFGAGQNLNDAYIPLKIKQGNQKIAFIGFTRWVNAKHNQPGTTPANIKKLTQIVIELKQDDFFVVIMPHWNYEYVYFPAPDNRRFARKLIDSGADLIVGSHPHIIQGYESYKNKYIFYSLGNFIFHSDVFKTISMIENDARLKYTFILTITLEEDFEYQIKIIPLFTDNHILRLLTEEENSWFENKLTEISEILSDNRKYKKYFYRDAADISHQTTKMLKKLTDEQGLKNLLITLKRAKKQDMKIALYSLFQRKKSTKTEVGSQ